MTIIESPDYQADAERLAVTDIVIAMAAELPWEIADKLIRGEFIPDFMGMARSEYHRRNADGHSPCPQFIGSVERAIRIVLLP